MSLPWGPRSRRQWQSTVVRDRAPAVSCARMKQPTPGRANGHDCSAATVPILEIAQGDPVSLRERRLTWAELMMGFREVVLRCQECGGRAAVVSAISQPKVVDAILTCLGLAVRAPPITSARQTPFYP